MATIVVDGQSFDVAEGRNLLETCLELGFDLPYFCWHPAMGSVGSCRQCAVQVYANDDDQRGRLVMACMTPVIPGMRASTTLESVRQFRETSIEVLMANHPHDCPVCEEGGECHLQDMTVLSGHHHRTYRGAKKTYPNQNLGACIGHEMNRCITCYRCVRFYADYAGGADLQAMSSRENVYFGRHTDGTLESPFSGNLVEVCPTGVFTDKPYSQNFTRKWDLQSAPSICTLCSVGCNITPNERNGKIKRIVNRYHDDINGYFLCDRGRFGFAHLNHRDRPNIYALKDPKKGLVEVTPEAAWNRIADLFQQTPKLGLWGIGSTRASVEENHLLKQLVGDDRYFAGVTDKVHGLMQQIIGLYQLVATQVASLKDIEQSDAVLILGEDLTHTAPMMALSVRQSSRHRAFELADGARIPRWQDAAVRTIAQEERSPVMQLQSYATPLDSIASHTLRLSPDQMAEQVDTLTAAILTGHVDQSDDWSQQVAQELLKANHPCIITGTSAGSSALLAAAARLIEALSTARTQPIATALVMPDSNSLGLALSLPVSGAEALVTRLADIKTPQTLVCLQTDLHAVVAEDAINSMLQCGHRLLVIDNMATATGVKADIFMPATTFVESEGTLVNNEGRAQRYFSVYTPEGVLKDTWRMLVQLLALRHPNSVDKGVDHYDAMVAHCMTQSPCLAYLTQVAPDAHFQKAGLRAPRQSHRYSGRTAINAGVSVHEPRQPQEVDSGLAYSMEGISLAQASPLNTNNWAPGWNSNEAINKFQQEIDGPLKQGVPGMVLFEDKLLSAALPQFSAQEPLTGDRATRATHTAHTTTETIGPNELLAVRQPCIFGSDARANQSPSLQGRFLAARLQIHPDTAAEKGLSHSVHVTMGQQSVVLPIVLKTDVPKNILVIPDVPWITDAIQLSALPCAVTVEAGHA